MARKAIFIALDNSGSMAGAKVQALRAAMQSLISGFQEFLDEPQNRLDFAYCFWGSAGDTTTRFFYDTDRANLGYALASLEGLDASGSATDFDAFTTDAMSFFTASLAGSYDSRILVFLTDGDPNPAGSDDTAAANIADLLDRDTGLFQTALGTAVDCFAANIVSGSTVHTAKLDNTAQDGVPVLSASDTRPLTSYLRAVTLPLQQSDLWGFPVNWDGKVEEELAFRTEIIVSRDGTEQRIAQRMNPRVSWTFESLLLNDRLHQALRRISKNQGRKYIFPDPRTPSTLAADALYGAVSITLAGTLPDWVQAGQEIVLEAPDGDTAVSVIITLSGSVAALGIALPRDFPAGTKVRLGLTGRFRGATDINLLTNRKATVETGFDADPVRTPHPTFGVAPVILDGLELFDFPPNWSKPLQLGFEQPQESLDLDRGAVDALYPVRFTTRTTRLGYTVKNETDLARVKGLFYRSRGRQKRFFIPLWADELRPVGDVANLATTLTFQGPELYEAYLDGIAYRRLRVKLRDGTSRFIEITSIVLDGAGNTQFNMASVLVNGFLLDDIINMVWIAPVRLASDLLTIEWVTGGVAEVNLVVSTLEESV